MPQSNKSLHSIGMFDSGVGGLTVMQQLIKTLPHEHIIYFGDNARFPYGEKSPETIIRYCIENTIFLLEQNIKMLVIPCNTATTHALEKLQHIFNIPIVGVIEPGADKAVKITKNKRIAILGTKGTINSGAYQKEILKMDPQIKLFPIACPLLAPLVEEHFLNHPATQLIIKEYLTPLKDSNVDTILLGCTHYPLISPLIQAEVGEHVSIVDSATTCAERVAALLQTHQLETPLRQLPQHKYFVSDDCERFRSLGKSFLGDAIDEHCVTSTRHRG